MTSFAIGTLYGQHGRKSHGIRQGTRPSPRIWSGDANANSPPDFVTFENFKDPIACITFTVQKNVMFTLAVMATGDDTYHSFQLKYTKTRHFK